jgi:cytochrome b6-f complex iron-sulfur subunit
MQEDIFDDSKTPGQASAVTRRDFLDLAWKSLLALSGLLGLGWMVRYFSYQPDPAPPTVFDLGAVDQLPTGSVITLTQAQAALLPTSDGFRAVSLVCPHLGCVVEDRKDRFVCPCHGSQFNLDGSLKKGPATQSLRPVSLQISRDGHVILDTSEN